MDYTLIGLGFAILGILITIAIGVYQFYKQNRTLTVILKMQYDTILAMHHMGAVSYTHLTLPTIYSV